MTLLFAVFLLPVIVIVLYVTKKVMKGKNKDRQSEVVNEEIENRHTIPSMQEAYLTLFKALTHKYVYKNFSDVEWFQFISGYGMPGIAANIGYTELEIHFTTGGYKTLKIPSRKIWSIFQLPAVETVTEKTSNAQKYLRENMNEIASKKKKAKKAGYVAFNLNVEEYVNTLKEDEKENFMEELKERFENIGYYVSDVENESYTLRLNFQDMD